MITRVWALAVVGLLLCALLLRSTVVRQFHRARVSAGSIAQSGRDVARAGQDRRDVARQAVAKHRKLDLKKAQGTWNELTQVNGFPFGTKLVKVTNEPSGRALHVVRSGKPALELVKHEATIAARYRAGGARVHVESGAGGDSSKCVVRLVEHDPFSKLPKKMLWKGYQLISQANGSHTVGRPMPIGVNERGEQQFITLKPGRHIRITGASGSGKGNMGLGIIQWALWAIDADVYLCDLEGGVDFAPLKHGCKMYSSNAPGALGGAHTIDQTIDEAYRACLKRAGAMVGGGKNIKISRRDPMVLLVIDGTHGLTSDQWIKVHHYAAEVRKYGGLLVLVDQQATLPKAGKASSNAAAAIRLCVNTITFTAVDVFAARAALRREPMEHELNLPTGRGIFGGFWGEQDLRIVQTGWTGDGDKRNDPYTIWAAALPQKPRSGVNEPQKEVKVVVETGTDVQNPSEDSIHIEVDQSLTGAEAETTIDLTVPHHLRPIYRLLVQQGGDEVLQADIIRTMNSAKNTVRGKLGELETLGKAAQRRHNGKVTYWRALL